MSYEDKKDTGGFNAGEDTGNLQSFDDQPDDRFTTQDISEINRLIDDHMDTASGDSPEETPFLADSFDEINTTVEPLNQNDEAEKPEFDALPLDESSESDEQNQSDEPASDDVVVIPPVVPEEEGPIPKGEEPETVGSKDALKKKSKGLPKKNKKKNGKKIFLTVLTVLLILAAVGAVGIYLLYTANRMDISGIAYTPKEKTEIYTADHVQIASLYTQNRTYVSIDQVPQDLKNALVATEDSRFYSHNGVDYIGVLRALASNVLGRSSTGQGASTLTQQLARLLYLPDIATESTFMDSLNRKFKEISIAYQLEEKYTKDQIMEMYLNEYYFGSGAYGIEAASETYFGKPVSQLNLAECAMLAGLPQAPSVYAPNVDFEAAKARQKQVLQRMVAAGYITEQQSTDAYNTPINVVPWSENSINNQISAGYQDYVNMVLQEYAKSVAPTVMKERGLSEDEAIAYTRSNVASGGYKFYTTVYSTYQTDAISTMENRLANYGFDQSQGYTGALVTVDRDGAVMAYYGGNEAYSDIDMADSPRQPGSNIKPLYYAQAIETGLYTTSSTLKDEPININGYSPQNYGGGYSGDISFAQSLIQSKNVTSVQIFNNLGVQSAVDWIKQFGFTTVTDNDYNLATALGGLTDGVKCYEMAAAFNTFNNNGVYNQPYFIQKATTTSGETVVDKSSLGLVSKQVMSQSTAETMYGLMRQVVTSGTGTAASQIYPTAGKTGTTDNEENLWFTGMTGNITTSVWIGNLDYEEVGGGSYIPAGIYGTYVSNLIDQDLLSQYNPAAAATLQEDTNSYKAPEAAADSTASASDTTQQ